MSCRARSKWQGTRDPAAHLSVPAAIRFQAEHDWPRVRAECHELLREARRRIEELTGLPGICPEVPVTSEVTGTYSVLCWPNIVIRSRKVTHPVVLW